MDPKLVAHSLDLAILELADQQYQVAAVPQLAALGLTRDGVRSRVRRGWMFRVYRGVYAIGTRRLSKRGRWMAAVLSCGPNAGLSGPVAGAHWKIHSGADLHVTVPTPGGRSRREGITIHRRPRAEIIWHQRLRVTTVGWTLVDLAAILPQAALLDAVDEAERLRLWSWREFDALGQTRHGDRGLGRLRQLRSLRDPSMPRARNAMERAFLRLCRRYGLPRPELNIEFLSGRYVADFLWREARLIVETDGRESHDTPAGFHNDRDRDSALAPYGLQTLRFTWWDIRKRPAIVASRLRSTLRIRGLDC